MAEVSACDRYSVCQIRTEAEPFWESWRTRAHEDGPGMIQTGLPTAEFARQLCAEHAPKGRR